MRKVDPLPATTVGLEAPPRESKRPFADTLAAQEYSLEAEEEVERREQRTLPTPGRDKSGPLHNLRINLFD